MELIGLLIAGIIVGLLGKFLAPRDKDNIPIWLTLVCGVGGVLLGYVIADGVGVKDTNGVDWLRWLISVGLAAVLVMLASALTGRSSSRRSRSSHTVL